MTGQAAEILVHHHRPRKLLDEPLHPWIATQPGAFSFAEPVGVPPEVRSTNCWRGYIGRWIIGDDGALRLAGLSRPGRGLRWRKPPEDHFPGCRQGVFAHWISGVLRVAWGRLRRYHHAGYARDYEHEAYLLFRRGRFVREVVLRNPPGSVHEAAVARSNATETPFEPVFWRERDVEVFRLLGLSPAEPAEEDWVEDGFDDDPANAQWADRDPEWDEHGRIIDRAKPDDGLPGDRHDAERRWIAVNHPDVRITPVTIAQAEALGRIDAPPESGTPALPFGHLHPAWLRFVALMRPGDQLACVDIDAGRITSRSDFWLRWWDYRSIHLMRGGRSVQDFIYEGM